jgi:16S rRNA processing protein RimM
VVKPQGNRGEVGAELHTDFPERFAERRRVFALGSDGRRRELQLEDFWPHKGRMILKFAGVDSISQAEELAGAEIQIAAGDRAELEAGSSYVSDLVGCAVLITRHQPGEEGSEPVVQEIGRVADVQFGAGEAPLLVVRGEAAGSREHLIPFAQPYLRCVDTVAKQIVMMLPEGLLELDAPLSREEKERQSRGQ